MSGFKMPVMTIDQMVECGDANARQRIYGMLRYESEAISDATVFTGASVQRLLMAIGREALKRPIKGAQQ
jgi:hypothetical protein